MKDKVINMKIKNNEKRKVPIGYDFSKLSDIINCKSFKEIDKYMDALIEAICREHRLFKERNKRI